MQTVNFLQNESAATLQSPFDSYAKIRKVSEELCLPLVEEDFVVQASDFASPPKWNLGHTTWFFETFILKPQC
jgi:hypothetical protein